MWWPPVGWWPAPAGWWPPVGWCPPSTSVGGGGDSLRGGGGDRLGGGGECLGEGGGGDFFGSGGGGECLGGGGECLGEGGGGEIVGSGGGCDVAAVMVMVPPMEGPWKPQMNEYTPGVVKVKETVSVVWKSNTQPVPLNTAFARSFVARME